MLKKGFEAISKELKGYSKFEKLFILCVMLCSFCITSEYSITKPVSYSVFISYFSASFFPYAWLAILPLNFVVVWAYGKILPKLGCFKATALSAFAISMINIISANYLPNSSSLSFFHFVWKDIYVLLMFQHLWSVVHSTISQKRAKYLYGIIYGIGGMGSIFGSCVAGFFATKFGSEKLLFLSPMIYVFFTLFYFFALKIRSLLESEDIKPIDLKKERSSKGGFALIYKSPYLRFIVLIVVLMQLSSTFIDFQFNEHLQQLIPKKDLRTEFSARIFGVIHGVNIFLQFFGAFFLIQTFGLKRSHFIIPSLFAINCSFCLVFPTFAMVSLSYSTIKACDYSVFTILKEMLYIPLNVEEKFKAKAVIDVFAYRSSKALASFAILFLQWMQIKNKGGVLSLILLSLFIIWVFAVSVHLNNSEGQTKLKSS
jgi:ATP/ADP translocase